MVAVLIFLAVYAIALAAMACATAPMRRRTDGR